MSLFSRIFLSGTLLLGACAIASGQSSSGRFDSEVQELASQMPANKKDVVLFTGSSSIRIWDDMETYFPNYNVVNRGFGGSSMSDLLYYCDDLIFKLRPAQIFIYEGDNDLAHCKSPESILATSDSLIQKIRRNISTTVPIYFISAKPSIARWKMKDNYLLFNEKLEQWTKSKINVMFIDGWSSLIGLDGNVMSDVFKADNLHLNEKGYSLWSKPIKAVLP
ncbi:MAG: GDSL-type esterase/lipase family protein [Chryseolinea sp.]